MPSESVDPRESSGGPQMSRDPVGSIENDLTLELPNDLQTIERVVEHVVRCCRSNLREEDLGMNFRVGLTEALSNAMLYGNERDPSKRVRVDVCVKGQLVTARVTDQGNGFDPDTVPDPTEPANITKPCGRGLFLMRQLCDEVSFNDKGNSVTLVIHVADCGESDRLGGGARA